MDREETGLEPLPQEWLPGSRVPPAEDEDYWNRRVRLLMEAAEPALARYGRHPLRLRWWAPFAGRPWPAVAGALGVAAGLWLAVALGAPPAAWPEGDPALAAVATGGEPAALWAAAGAPVDPVLALLALEAARPGEGGSR